MGSTCCEGSDKEQGIFIALSFSFDLITKKVFGWILFRLNFLLFTIINEGGKNGC